MISLPRIPRPAALLGLLSLCLLAVTDGAATDVANHVPARAPRTQLLPGRIDAFRSYATSGAGAAAFARIREDFDRDYLKLPFPSEPLTYGDPNPRARDSEKADRWRQARTRSGPC